MGLFDRRNPCVEQLEEVRGLLVVDLLLGEDLDQVCGARGVTAVRFFCELTLCFRLLLASARICIIVTFNCTRNFLLGVVLAPLKLADQIGQVVAVVLELREVSSLTLVAEGVVGLLHLAPPLGDFEDDASRLRVKVVFYLIIRPTSALHKTSRKNLLSLELACQERPLVPVLPMELYEGLLLGVGPLVVSQVLGLGLGAFLLGGARFALLNNLE